MKKIIVLLFLSILLSAYSFSDSENKNFDVNDFYDYQKEFEAEEIDSCSQSSVKTYMDYRMTTVKSSPQYIYLNEKCTVDQDTGFLYDEDGFIAVALGSFYGDIGDRFYFTLDSGVVLPLVKAESKADKDTDDFGCSHLTDNSVIEFVIDAKIARNYFYSSGNGLVLNGNYNNYSVFKGKIVKVEKVSDIRRTDLVTYENIYEDKDLDIFYYGSGY